MTSKTEIFNNYETNEELQYYDSFESEELGINESVLKGIFAFGYEKPSAIQRIGMKPIMDGRDSVIQSHSGSGKTATFIIGLLHRIVEEERTNQCIIISNTRELADQTFKVFKELTKFTKITGKLCIGGDMGNKYNDDRINEHVIIGTPGRLCDLLNKNIISGDTIKIIVVDEADDVLSSSFKKQVKKIFRTLSQDSQVVLLSATIPEEMSELFPLILKPDYLSVFVKDDELSLEGIKQYYVYLNENDKFQTLIELYKVLSIGQAIVYCNTKFRADDLCHFLNDNNFTASVLHGDMMQKERKDIMNQFRCGKYRILITTDILARGIDVQQVSLVINYDMPKYPQTFIHRSGRGGRQGRKGITINFVTKREKSILYTIEKTYSIRIDPLPESIDEISRF